QVVDPVQGQRYRSPSFLIFDEATRLAGPIATRVKHSYNQRFRWSDDNSEELVKGWIKVGTCLEELAIQLRLPPDKLEQAICEYNDGCEGGVLRFGRSKDQMRRLDGPPFYGIPLWPALSNTQGGPRRNEHARVLDVFGKEIPGLYSAGELGSIW